MKIFKRFYDKKQYQKLKRLEKSADSKQTLQDSISLIQQYSFNNPLRFNCYLGQKVNSLLKLKGIMQPLKVLVNSSKPFKQDFNNLKLTMNDSEQAYEDFDLIISSKQDFPNLVKIAKILGPMGKMPSFSNGLVSDDINNILENLNESSVLKSNSDGILDIEIGTESALQNLKLILHKLMDLKPVKMESNFD